MTINLSEIVFENDFYRCVLPNDMVLTINRIDEDFIHLGEEIKVDGINIELSSEDNEQKIHCSSVIGLEQDYISIETDYTEYIGTCLSKENLMYCRIVTNE